MPKISDSCPHCETEERKNRGFLCDFETSDKMGLRCCGPQTFEKLKILKYYLEIFTKAMKGRFTHLNFVDLFAGSGKCRNRENGIEAYGSSLISFTLEHGFTNYVFNDLNEETSKILLKRCEIISPSRMDHVKTLNSDANTHIDDILKKVPKQSSLSVIFIDPNGLDIHFDTLKKLSQYSSIDLILNYAVLDLKRNRKTYEGENDKADKFFGPVDWREMTPSEMYFAYKNSIKELGFEYLEDDFEGTVRVQTQTNADIYYLMFASKDPLGLKFWRAAKNKYSQPSLFDK